MKKRITIVALAKNIENEEALNATLKVEIWAKINSVVEKLALVLPNYAYLYQTTCGKLFGIVLNKPIWELTANEREDLDENW